ncbi:MAG TPA: flavin reductase family protein [Vicinamibacterales bacterium]|nr:flavin reductase family protein [Vicinamibacterales bacterium]
MSSPVDLFRRLTNGVYVITASHAGQSNGFTAAWVTQVSFNPLLLMLSVHPEHATWPLIETSGRFVVNVLGARQLELARHFGTQSGREVDKLSTVPTMAGGDGAVVLTHAAAWLACQIDRLVPAGDHVVVIARVVAGEVLDPATTPLRYLDTGNMDGSAALFATHF